MKKISSLIIIALFAILLFTSCERDNIEPNFKEIAKQEIYNKSVSWNNMILLNSYPTNIIKSNKDIIVKFNLTIQYMKFKTIKVKDIYNITINVYFYNGNTKNIHIEDINSYVP